MCVVCMCLYVVCVLLCVCVCVCWVLCAVCCVYCVCVLGVCWVLFLVGHHRASLSLNLAVPGRLDSLNDKP